MRPVIKSISSLGRVPLLTNALPDARIVLILRDPRAHVASMLRGVAMGKFERQIPIDTLLEAARAKGYNLTMQKLNALPLVEQLAWHWAILNEKSVTDLAGMPNARLLQFEEFAREPIENTKAFSVLPDSLGTGKRKNSSTARISARTRGTTAFTAPPMPP